MGDRPGRGPHIGGAVSGTGWVAAIHVSGGGVPKTPVPYAEIRVAGVEGDRQANQQSHGGPDRAVLLWSAEVIAKLRAEGHPIAPGLAGENLTLAGLDWTRIVPGVRLEFDGGVILEAASFCAPCWKIAAAFAQGEFNRIHHDRSPGDSRVCARVIREGRVKTGDGVTLIAG